jgi:hypothetical protein
MGFRPYFPYEHSSGGMSAILELIADTLIFHTVFSCKKQSIKKSWPQSKWRLSDMQEE